MPRILVTNDDGVSSQGIKALANAVKSLGEVFVVAPATEQSAVAHALTMHRPLKCNIVSDSTYSVNGTPTDCVIVAVNKILPVRPDIIVSGINHGGNLGDNVSYSGTVAAAIEGAMLGIPSLAISLVTDYSENGNVQNTVLKLDKAAEYARIMTAKVLDTGLPAETLLNINIPSNPEIRGIKITKQGRLTYENAIQDIKDPWGRNCFWIGGGIPKWEAGGNTDVDAVQNGYISVTPVRLDLTSYEAIQYIKEKWEL